MMRITGCDPSTRGTGCAFGQPAPTPRRCISSARHVGKGAVGRSTDTLVWHTLTGVRRRMRQAYLRICAGPTAPG